MKHHHAVVYLKNESDPILKIVCVDPDHKAGTREQDCPVQDWALERGWPYFYMTEGKKEIFKFDFQIRGVGNDSSILFTGEYNAEESEDVAGIAQRDSSGD